MWARVREMGADIHAGSKSFLEFTPHQPIHCLSLGTEVARNGQLLFLLPLTASLSLLPLTASLSLLLLTASLFLLPLTGVLLIDVRGARHPLPRVLLCGHVRFFGFSRTAKNSVREFCVNSRCGIVVSDFTDAVHTEI